MLEFKYIFGENGYKITRALRETVFSGEMNFTENTDELEENSYHFVGYDGIKQISAARLTRLTESDYLISYVAVEKSYRRQYVGDLIMRALADKTVALCGARIFVTAPQGVRGFFEYEGYEEVQIERGGFVKMMKDLAKVETKCRGCGA